MKIALGAAKGLAFLHEARNPVIYRDFKASNILLDSVSTLQQYQISHVSQYFFVVLVLNSVFIISRTILLNYQILVSLRMVPRETIHTFLLELWAHMAMRLLNTS